MIALLKPDMPTADDLLPYLRRIDESKIYSNGGPLVRELEEHFGAFVGARTVAVSNGTVAIELALRSLKIPRGSAVLMPAMTFAATGLAAWNAGLRPVLGDVDPLTWQLTAETAMEAVRGCQVRAVLVVAAFGLPVPVRPWEIFAAETGVQVIIDAAGAIAEQEVSAQPLVLTTFSLHATKFIGAGEGGLVAGGNKSALARIAEMTNFGHWGTNAKMSEYHAAVALASSSVPSVNARMERARPMVNAYRAGLVSVPVTVQRPPRADATILVVKLPIGCTAAETYTALRNADIEAKQWYRPFLDERKQFAGCMRPFSLPVTSDLRDHAIGLPFHTSLTAADATRVCEAVAAFTSTREHP